MPDQFGTGADNHLIRRMKELFFIKTIKVGIFIPAFIPVYLEERFD
jgi:hypothetical protein